VNEAAVSIGAASSRDIRRRRNWQAIRAVLAGRQLVSRRTRSVWDQAETASCDFLGRSGPNAASPISGQRLWPPWRSTRAAALVPRVPIRLARPVMRKHRHSADSPVETSARIGSGIHDAEPNIRENIVGLIFAPTAAGFLFERAASAGRHRTAPPPGLFEQPAAQAVKRHAFEPEIRPPLEIPGSRAHTQAARWRVHARPAA